MSQITISLPNYCADSAEKNCPDCRCYNKGHVCLRFQGMNDEPLVVDELGHVLPCGECKTSEVKSEI